MLLINAIQDFAINQEEFEEPFSVIEGIYLGWTPLFVKEQISDRLMSAMGGLDYLSLTAGTHPVLFSRIKAKQPDEPLRVLAVMHTYIHQFLHCLWLIKDNSVNADVGFVHSIDSQGKEVASSNSRASVYTCADGCRREIEYSRAELIKARTLYERLTILGQARTHPSTLNPISQVEPTGTVVTADAVRALTRISYFVNSARDCSDLSVKVAHYSTCLEILFSTDSSEISHKLAERVALFLGQTFEERKRIFNRVKRLYSVRSKVVHGDVFSKSTLGTLREISLDADDLLRQLLRLILDSDELCALFEGSKESREEYFIDLVLQTR
jgi:hypothetical protein